MTSVKCCHLLILPEHYRHWHDINPYTSNILVKRDVSEKKQLIWLGVEYWNILLIFHVNVLYIKCSLNTVTASRKFEILTLGIWISQWLFLSLLVNPRHRQIYEVSVTLFEGTRSWLWLSKQNLQERNCQF